MKKPFAISRLLLFLALGGLISLSFLAIRVLEQDVRAYRESNQEAIHWSSAQIEVELSRFILSLTRFASGDPDVDAARVNERFDILWSRTGLFRSGKIGSRLRQYDVELGTIPLMLSKLEQYEAQIVDIGEANPAQKHLMVREFTALQDPLRRLSVKVLSGEQQRYASVRRNLLSSSRMTFWVWVATLVLAAVLIGVMFIESRRYVRAIRETQKLVEQAQAADRAKSRFLTMMSHELRTPMNGVLGLMALAKQAGMNDSQLRLIDQAERSGAEMVALLNDILDFSDLQTDKLELSKTAFEPIHLLNEIEAAISDIVSRNGVSVNARLAPEMPDWLSADQSRLRQAISYFIVYFIETVGSRTIGLELLHEAGRLTCRIDVDAHDGDRPGWQPEAVFGHDGSSSGDFASDAVGPMIARGLINLMGGHVRIRRTIDSRASLSVSIPSDPAMPLHDSIRIEISSDTTGLLLRAALAETRWRVWDPKMDNSRVHACVVEAGRPDEAELVEKLRALHPGAAVVALGRPQKALLFDALCEMPLNRSELIQALESESEERRRA